MGGYQADDRRATRLFSVTGSAKIHRTPAGVTQNSWLTTPDTRIDARGQYKVTLLMPTERAQPLISLVDTTIAESVAQAKKQNPTKAKRIKPTTDKPYRMILYEKGRDTGEVSFCFRLMAHFTRRETGQILFKRPDLFDAKCRPLSPTRINIGDGSTIKAAFEILPFYTFFLGAGVSLRLRAVQVLNLVQPPGRGATDYGFVEEGGYEADDDKAQGATSTSTTASPMTVRR
jgi:hypothetical protein